MMGAGKTQVGRALGARIGRPFRDLDAAVELAAGRTIADLFDAEGEAAFREREHEALEKLLTGSPIVLATGGGAVIHEASRTLLATKTVSIWLDAAPATLAARLEDKRDRPLLRAGNKAEVLGRLLEARRSFYTQAPIRIVTDPLMVSEVVHAILAALDR